MARLFFLACENSRFSSLLVAWDVSPGETSVPQRQIKPRIDDVNQRLHHQFGRHGLPNENLFDFMFLLVDFGNCLFLSANDLQ